MAPIAVVDHGEVGMRRSTESPRAFMRSLSRMKDWTLTERGHSAAILDDQLSWRDRALYVWLSEIGLTPAKSLSLGPLAVPDQCFADFFRGCIDGDSSVASGDRRASHARKWIDRDERTSGRSCSVATSLCEGGINSTTTVDVLRIQRSVSRTKKAKAQKFLSPLGHAPLRHTGRPRAGGYTM